jgi:pimeloyl-ACP methyl ester carboxylesterase
MEQWVSLVTLEVNDLPRAGCGHTMIEERSLAVIGNGAPRAGASPILSNMAAGLGTDVMVEQLRAIQKRSDQKSILRKCRVPAALICGELDPRVQPKRHEFMATLIHCATLHVIPNVGHSLTFEQPEMINAALWEWLVQPIVLR